MTYVPTTDRLRGKHADCEFCGGRHSTRAERSVCIELHARINRELDVLVVKARRGERHWSTPYFQQVAIINRMQTEDEREEARAAELDAGMVTRDNLPTPTLDQFMRYAGGWSCQSTAQCLDEAAGFFPCDFHRWQWHREHYCVLDGRVYLRRSRELAEKLGEEVPDLNVYWRRQRVIDRVNVAMGATE